MEIIDDFFDNPYDIRNIALKCDRQTVDVAYPGIRKKSLLKLLFLHSNK